MPKVGHIATYKDGYRIFVERHGKKRTEVFRGTYREAEIRAAQIAAEMGVPSAYPEDITLKDYWEEVFPDRLSNRGKPRSRNTFLYYAAQMKKNILPKLGHEKLNDITHEQLAEVIRSSTAPTNTKRTLMAVLRSAYDDGLMKDKPLDRRVPTRKNPKKKYEPWNPLEAQEALEKLTAYPQLKAYAVLGLSGLGMEEALGLRWKDIHEEPPYLSISHTYTDTGGHLKTTKNDFRTRIAPIFVLGRDFILQYKLENTPTEASSLAETAKLIRSWEQTRAIPLRGDTLYKTWKKALNELDIRYIPPSNLRHTSDTLALDSGVRSELNDKLHGRTNPTVTYSSYYRPSLEEMEEAAQLIAENIRKP